MTNRPETADHARSIFFNPEGSPFAIGGYWLTKRRDGRSGNWMIARYQPHNRSIVYRSCKTRDLDLAKARLAHFAASNPNVPAPVAKRTSTSVYFIEAATGHIKIGTAGNVGARLAALRTASPVPLSLLAVTDGGQPREFAYHQQFAAHRLHGEWFNPHPDILAEIERLGALSLRGAA